VKRAQPETPRYRVLALETAAMLLLAAGERWMGGDIDLALLYLGPAGGAAWWGGTAAGRFIAALSPLAPLAFGAWEEILSGLHWALLANAMLQCVLLLIFVQWVARLRLRLASQQALVRTDPLTGVLNSRAFLEELQHRLDLAARGGQSIAIAYLDLDDFKLINDIHGHLAGDQTIGAVAQTMAATLRRTDLIARMGGDEFACLFSGVDLAGAEVAIDKLRQAILRSPGPHGMVTTSVGCVVIAAHFPDAIAALSTADRLMYVAKARGKNCVVFRDHHGSQADSADTPSVLPQTVS
jgi:diguanylate cyclase (GGDEF)-like protein